MTATETTTQQGIALCHSLHHLMDFRCTRDCIQANVERALPNLTIVRNRCASKKSTSEINLPTDR